MAEYSVKCENCMNVVYSDSIYSVDNIVKVCRWCSGDICSECDFEDGMNIHFECSVQENDDEDK